MYLKRETEYVFEIEEILESIGVQISDVNLLPPSGLSALRRLKCMAYGSRPMVVTSPQRLQFRMSRGGLWFS